MKYVLLVAILLVLSYVTVHGIQLWNHLQIGKSLAVRAVLFQFFDAKNSETIFIIGDSTALGTGALSPRESVAGQFHKMFPRYNIVVNAENGLRLKDIRSRIKNARVEKARLTIIQGGGNDILRFTNLGDMRSDLEAIVEHAKSFSENVVLLHSGNVGAAPFFPAPLSWILSYRTRRVRALYQDVALKENAIYIDLYTNKKQDPFLKDPGVFYAPDMLHPSSDGYRLWFEKILATLLKVGVDLNTD